MEREMSESKVLDFNKKKTETIEQKKRAFERIVFQNFLGAYSVLDANGSILPVTLVDISYDGCSFQTPATKKLEKETEVTLRMYFTQHSFVPVVVKVKHGTETMGTDGQKYMQYGCEFDKSLPSFEALNSFIDFMYKFAKHSAVDKGDTKVFFY